jgi:hypothetical protein
MVVDNDHTHHHANVEAWLANHPHITLHFTPTSGSWLTSSRRFIDGWNLRCHPFTWSKTADEVLPQHPAVHQLQTPGISRR